MAETTNISKIAEKASNDIFKELNWDILKATNMNWKCVKDKHLKKTHPSDVVFTYKEPYKNLRTYINTDLKSYSISSINKGTIRTAINSLALSIQCAEVSEEWQKFYKHYNENFQIVGLLFVYNHDGDFDKDFILLLNQTIKKDIYLEKSNKIFVIGPSEICYLQTIVNDIKVMRADGHISIGTYLGFYYPDLINSKLHWTGENMAATLEMITSPFQICRFKDSKKKHQQGCVLYYKRSGENLEEFIYLFDYLLHYQLIENDSISYITIKLAFPHKNAINHFEAAKIEYAIRFESDKSFSKRFSKVKYSTINSIITKFSDIDLGMINE